MTGQTRQPAAGASWGGLVHASEAGEQLHLQTELGQALQTWQTSAILLSGVKVSGGCERQEERGQVLEPWQATQTFPGRAYPG